jgi:hypothetical protein
MVSLSILILGTQVMTDVHHNIYICVYICRPQTTGISVMNECIDLHLYFIILFNILVYYICHYFVVFSAGDVYEGSFVAGDKCGRGNMVYVHGDEYVGEWRDDKEHGVYVSMHHNNLVYVKNEKIMMSQVLFYFLVVAVCRSLLLLLLLLLLRVMDVLGACGGCAVLFFAMLCFALLQGMASTSMQVRGVCLILCTHCMFIISHSFVLDYFEQITKCMRASGLMEKKTVSSAAQPRALTKRI